MKFQSGWIILGVIVLAIMLVVNLIKRKQAAATFLATMVTILLVLTMGYVYLSNDLRINSVGDLIDGGKVYFSWVASAFKNTADITSYAIQKDWKNEGNNSAEVG